MKTAVKYLGEVPQGSAFAILARELGWAGTPITQASLAGITYKVTPANASTVASGSVTISESVFDALQTSDPRWAEDHIGFNFLHIVPAAAMSVIGKNVVEYTFTPASGEIFKDAFEVKVVDTNGP